MVLPIGQNADAIKVAREIKHGDGADDDDDDDGDCDGVVDYSGGVGDDDDDDDDDDGDADDDTALPVLVCTPRIIPPPA